MARRQNLQLVLLRRHEPLRPLSKLRNEPNAPWSPSLNRNCWPTLLEARVVIEDFKDDHHRHRHSALATQGRIRNAWSSRS